MKTYIGTKIIQAESMTDGDFAISKGKDWEPNKPHCVGYKVIYPDGYESWSPSFAFESAYREVLESEIKLIKND